VTERIDSILAAVDGLDPTLLDALDDADRADALNRALNPGDPDRGRALAILARSAPGSGGPLAAAVSQILAVAAADPFAAAGASLAAVAIGPEAVPLLMAVAVVPDPVVALPAWRALQQVAGADVVEQLQALAPPPGDVIGDQAAFALSVIAYRAGLIGLEQPVPAETEFLAVEGDEAELHSIEQFDVNEADFQRLARLSAGELYMLAPTPEATTAIDCGGDHMLLCMDPAVQARIPGRLTQLPALAGLVLLRDPDDVGYGVRYLVLTWPDDEGGFHVALHQPDGSQMYYGHAKGESVTARASSSRCGAERSKLSIELNGSPTNSGPGSTINPASSPAGRLAARSSGWVHAMPTGRAPVRGVQRSARDGTCDGRLRVARGVEGSRRGHRFRAGNGGGRTLSPHSRAPPHARQ
jgi:hypothetical protein